MTPTATTNAPAAELPTLPTVREIYEYDFAGTRRYADPAIIRRRLTQATMGELDLILAETSQPFPLIEKDMTPEQIKTTCELMVERERYQEKLYLAVCQAFGLPVFDEATGGATENEAIGIYNAYVRWCQGNERRPGS